MFDGDRGLRVGTSSWSSADWVGVFYPERTPPKNFLEHYATVYDTVEVDSTFYHAPSESTVRGWRERTPEGFIFSAKVPRVVTHEKVLVNARDEMFLFLETMSGLEDRLGPLLLQFPYFNRRAFPGPRAFLERLDGFLAELPRDFRYVVEIRNRSWLGREIQTICARHRVTLAWIEQAWMPHPKEWRRRLGFETPGGLAYLRFLGDHKAIEEITRKWDRTVIDRSAQIEAWVPVIQELRESHLEVFTYFNNHFSGHAPDAIELFREIWRRSQESRANDGASESPIA